MKSESAHIFNIPSTGTGGLETALSNTLLVGDTVLATRNGVFSRRWIDMCQRRGLNVTVLETPWGNGLPAVEYEEILRTDKGRKPKLFLQHTTKLQLE